MLKRKVTQEWFESLRDEICSKFEQIESEYAKKYNLTSSKFERKTWERSNGGGGVISIMRGNVFEKVGVNVSTVFGKFSPDMQMQVPGAIENPEFFATGVSLVAHMKSPLVPAAHFNTRYIETTKSWFGGGSDLTPIYPDDKETALFHQYFKDACEKHSPLYYPQFKKQCDEYFYLPHRKESRGVGGIFYDYLNSGSFDDDFAFTKDVGKSLSDVLPILVREKMHLKWTPEERDYQLYKRGRYVEFNLLYDRGTKFGFMTGGNPEAILMSMPPEVKW